MPDRSTGGDALSRKLRELRAAAGLRQVDAAEQAGISQSLIAKFENGRQVPRPDQAETLTGVYRASAQDRRELTQLAEDLREGTRRVVVRRQSAAIQQQIRRVVESSLLVRTFSPIGIPGLLQTTDYVRALFTTGGATTPEDQAGAEQRIANQAVLTEDPARRFVMLMPEGSLGWALIPPARMASQIEHITAMSQRGNIRIGIIPWGRVSSTLPLHSWEIYDERAVITGSTTGTTVLTTRPDVDAYLRLFATLEQLACYDDEAHAILNQVAERYRRLAGHSG